MMTRTTDKARAEGPGNTRFGKTFLALFGLGLLGVLSMIPTVIGQLDALPPELADLPAPLAVALSLASPAVLLAISVAIGTLVAHRVGLRSLVARRIRQGNRIWPDLRPHIPMAFAAGIVFSLVLVGLDQLMDPFADTELLAELVGEVDLLGQLLVGLLYGGIVEELLLRWGIMSLLVWIGWRLAQRAHGRPRPALVWTAITLTALPALVWTAITLTALLFGIGHVPAMATIVPLTPLIVFRTVVLNGLGGLLFGWLFWKRNLEVAMVAHASTHVGIFAINAVVVLLNLGAS